MSTEKNKYVLEIKTIQIAPFRTLMTALKGYIIRNKYYFLSGWY